MSRSPFQALFAALFLLVFAAVAHAEEPSAIVKQRSAQLIPLLNGTLKPEDLFAPSFLSAIPSNQFKGLSRQLTDQMGPAKAIESLEMKGPSGATLKIAFDHGSARAEMAVEQAVPNRITGLAITGTEVTGDTLAKVAQDIWALPGQASLAVARLDGPDLTFSIAHKSSQAMGIGSAFKLFLLAELNWEIEHGDRKWSDVVRLDQRSIQTGFLQTWPEGAPITLHTLAALMISQSDNTAADTMLHLLGRERVEGILPAIGIADPARLRPLLATREVALLKAGKDASLGAIWASGSEQQRRALLGRMASIPPEDVDVGKLLAAPKAIDTIEWLASTADLVRVMNWLRLHGDKQTIQILGINPGVPPATAQLFSYIGYKGGSETGVMNMTFLLRTKDGRWYSVAGTWNDPAHAVDENRFILLMNRAVTLLN